MLRFNPWGIVEQVAQPPRQLSACRSRRADADGLAVLQGSATRIRAQTSVAQARLVWRRVALGRSASRTVRLVRPPAFTSPPSTTGEPSDRHDGCATCSALP